MIFTPLNARVENQWHVSLFPRGGETGKKSWSALLELPLLQPLLTQPRHEEITALHLMHYQKIPTCNEAGLTMTFYKGIWEECFVIK